MKRAAVLTSLILALPSSAVAVRSLISSQGQPPPVVIVAHDEGHCARRCAGRQPQEPQGPTRGGTARLPGFLGRVPNLRRDVRATRRSAYTSAAKIGSG